MDIQERKPDAGLAAERNVPLVVRALMGAWGLDQQSLAKAVEMEDSALSKSLRGKRKFTVREIAELAQFFGVDPGLSFRDPKSLLGSATLDELRSGSSVGVLVAA